MTTRRYLESLERRLLNQERWEEPSDIAALRFAGFPSVAELYDITFELQQRAGTKAKPEWITKMPDKRDRHQADDERNVSAFSRLPALK